jgi:hemoglobin/transferrin/lactoferrin receptor protein
MSLRLSSALGLPIFFITLSSRVVSAQTPDTTRSVRLEPITVTATRNEKAVFETPMAVSVTDSATLHRAGVNTAVDLFRDLPGLDVTGVGTNQIRPSIRGQRGQRILLLEDGIRMNNSRRQQDFGELPSLVDVESIERVEVVRGPASVLYGTDAIGGVVNLITTTPPSGPGNALHGRLGYRYGSSDTQERPSGSVFGRVGGFRFGLDATYRVSDAYDAPAGKFGDLHLASDTRVHDTGVEDRSYRAQAGYGIGEHHDLLLDYEQYTADHAGFGYVDAAAIGRPDDPFIQIRYPHQQVNRVSARYQGRSLNTLFADRVNVTGYTLGNKRDLDMNIFIPFGTQGPPGSGVAIQSQNFTDLRTYGFRAEAIKALAGRHTLTYGVDFFRDRSNNTDASATTVIGFGPPAPQVDSTPQIPNATFRSAGVFAQTELAIAPRVTVILGARYQDVKAATRPTPRISDPLISSSAHTAVGTANLLFKVTENLNLIGTVGRGFRAPDLVELFFQGVTPEGSGFQSRNPALKPETSVNLELGFKYRLSRLYLEGFAFRNTIHDGIRIAATGDTVAGFPEFQNINVDKLRFSGFELQGDLDIASGISLGLNYAHLRSKDVLNPKNPVGESYADKLGVEARYRSPSSRVLLSYGVRYQGKQKDAALGSSPIGTELPSFMVHTARAGVRLFSSGPFTNTLDLVVHNVTNRLYAESANASFFRPEPGRSVTVAWTVGF